MSRVCKNTCRISSVIAGFVVAACMASTARTESDERQHVQEYDIQQIQKEIEGIGVENIPLAIVVEPQEQKILLFINDDPERIRKEDLGEIGDEQLNFPGKPGSVQFEDFIGLTTYSCVVVTDCETVGGKKECEEYHIPPGC